MLVMSIACQVAPATLIAGFTAEAPVIGIGAEFLALIAWNFVPSALIITCSSLFQALGNTVPALLSSATRLLTFVLPLLLIARLPGLELRHVWWLSVGTTTLQALFSLWLLRREFRLKLRPAGVQPDEMLSTVTK